MPVPPNDSIVKQLVDRGMWIFPCELPSKKPYNNWKWSKHKIGAENVDMWLETAPVFGTELAKIGLWCCDLDKIYGKSFKAATKECRQKALDAVIERLGKPLARCRSRGKTKGWHLFYRLDRADADHGPGKFELPGKDGRILVKGDIRAAHGYVIMWDPKAIVKAMAAAAEADPVRIKLITGDPDEHHVDELADPGRDKISRVRSVLTELNLDDRQDWLECGMALHDFFGGSDEGLKLWDEYSAKFQGYTDSGCAEAWRSFKGQKSKKLTFRTLMKRANDALRDKGKQLIQWSMASPNQPKTAPANPENMIAEDDKGLAQALEKLGITPRYNTRSDKRFFEFSGESEVIFDVSGVQSVTKELRAALKNEIIRSFTVRDRRFTEPVGRPFNREDALWRDMFHGLFWHARYDPWADYLRKCEKKWDGKPRVKTFFTDTWNVADARLAEWAACYIFLLPVYRTFNAPYDCDQVLILQGEQDLGKSKTFKWLIPEELRPELYNGFFPLNQSHKQSVENSKGRVFLEMSEGAGRMAADLDTLKAMITVATDSMREAYGEHVADLHRTWCPYMTTNSEKPVPFDPSGNRRWVVIQLTRKRVMALDEAEARISDMRDQLWGEAMHLHKAGVSARLPHALKQTQAEINARFEDRDADKHEFVRGMYQDAVEGHGAISITGLQARFKDTPFERMSAKECAHILRDHSIAKPKPGRHICPLVLASEQARSLRTVLWEPLDSLDDDKLLSEQLSGHLSEHEKKPPFQCIAPLLFRCSDSDSRSWGTIGYSTEDSEDSRILPKTNRDTCTREHLNTDAAEGRFDDDDPSDPYLWE